MKSIDILNDNLKSYEMQIKFLTKKKNSIEIELTSTIEELNRVKEIILNIETSIKLLNKGE